MKKILLVCGVPGSGKSWVCRQVADRFNYIPHDRCWTHPTKKPDMGLDPVWPEGAKSTHFESIHAAYRTTTKDVLTECPFAERELRKKFEMNGCIVVPVFVIEDPKVVAQRYEKREGKPCSKNVLSRAVSIVDRAKEWNAFFGNTEQVLKHLRELPHG